MEICIVSMFWPTQLGFCLRGRRLLWDSTEAHTVLFTTVRSCQVLVNGFCLGLRWTAYQAWACSVQQKLETQYSPLHDGDMTHGSLSQPLTAAKYHSVFVQITRSHCIFFLLSVGYTLALLYFWKLGQRVTGQGVCFYELSLEKIKSLVLASRITLYR